MTNSPRRIMSNMLLMPTLKFGDPIQVFILVETNNLSRLTLKLTLRLHVRLSGWGSLLSVISGNSPTALGMLYNQSRRGLITDQFPNRGR